MKTLVESILSSTKTGINSIREAVEKWVKELQQWTNSGKIEIDKGFVLKQTKNYGTFINLDNTVYEEIPKIVKIGENYHLYITDTLYKKFYNDKRIIGPFKKVTICGASNIISDIVVDSDDFCNLAGIAVHKLKNISINLKGKAPILEIDSNITIEELKEIDCNCKYIILNSEKLLSPVVKLLENSKFEDCTDKSFDGFVFNEALNNYLEENLSNFKELNTINFAGAGTYHIGIFFYTEKMAFG